MFIPELGFWYELEARGGSEWVAGYKIPGDKPAFVILDDIKSAECPRSAMIRDPEMESLIQIFHQEQAVKGMGDPGKWPGAMYDVFLVLSDQQAVDKHAVNQALHKT